MTPRLLTALEEWISEKCDRRFNCEEFQAIGEGCIHRAFLLKGVETDYFAKINHAEKEDLFDAEFEALKALAESNSLRCPNPLGHGEAEGHSFLVMEALRFASGSTEAWASMGRQLAELHSHRAHQFGWPRDNYIGASPQHNEWSTSWPDFFREQRLRPQLEMARARGFRFSQEMELLESVEPLLAGHNPRPSLLHGDLWSGNAGFLADGTPVIYDPASYYGDRETDLALSEFFGGFPKQFYDAYQAAWPLNDGYPQRRALYNLYHVLNHTNLFGGSYANQAQAMIDALL